MLSPQLQTLRLYAELLSRYDTLASRLIFTHGARCSATGLAAAVNIAGGVSLLVDPDAVTVKATFRSGGLDFLVTNLDEALRVLKNEIRKHTPLSVALIADPAAVLAEMQARGVQPDLEISFGESPDSLALTSLSLATDAGLIQPSTHALAWLTARSWSENTVPAETTADLRALDVHLIQQLPSGDAIRLQWLRRIPHYVRPAAGTGRTIWLTPAEHAALHLQG